MKRISRAFFVLQRRSTKDMSGVAAYWAVEESGKRDETPHGRADRSIGARSLGADAGRCHAWSLPVRPGPATPSVGGGRSIRDPVTRSERSFRPQVDNVAAGATSGSVAKNASGCAAGISYSAGVPGTGQLGGRRTGS